jgi:integral membrane protein
MLSLFRLIAFIEGVTTVTLFMVAMPLKYWFGNPMLVPPVGMAHGVAFLVYVAALAPGLWGKGFTALQWLRTFAAAFVPFGTFLNDPLLRRKQAAWGADARYSRRKP